MSAPGHRDWLKTLISVVRTLGPICFIVLLIYKTQREHSARLTSLEDMLQRANSGDADSMAEISEYMAAHPRPPSKKPLIVEDTDTSTIEIVDETVPSLYKEDHREIFSLTTRSRKFFPIHWDGEGAYNPNILPHPTKHDKWIVVAQHEQSLEDFITSEEFSCTASFYNDVLICEEYPSVMPIEPSIKGQCFDDLAYFNFRGGPRDARMFYGPDQPHLVYGSQSGFACIGIWVRDARQMLPQFTIEAETGDKLFQNATELQRPPPWGTVEKNFFMFWDTEGKMYAHYDLWPRRVFAQVDYDGSVGPDLGPESAYHDRVCMAQYMPHIALDFESLHQATNSLKITMCERKDKGCIPGPTNTFIAHIFHHKTFYDFHGEYEPFIVLFQGHPPFALHAIAQKPYWIHGRNRLTRETDSIQYRPGHRYDQMPDNQTEMVYITSMTWKNHGQKYHGYLDDPLFLGFGIEDTTSGAIDVLAGDLMQDLAFCEVLT